MLEFAPASENYMRHEEAVLYCAFCNHNGHRDWRLPTWEEWKPMPGHVALGSNWYLNDGYLGTAAVIPVRDIC